MALRDGTLEVLRHIKYLMQFADESVTLSMSDWIGLGLFRQFLSTLPPGHFTEEYKTSLLFPFVDRMISEAPGALMAGEFATKETIEGKDRARVARSWIDWLKEKRDPAVALEIDRLKEVSLEDASPRPMGRRGFAVAARAAGLKFSHKERAGFVTWEELAQELAASDKRSETLYIAEDGKIRPDFLRVIDALRLIRTDVRQSAPPEKYRELVEARSAGEVREGEDDPRLARVRRAIASERNREEVQAVLDWQDGTDALDVVADRHKLDASRIISCWERIKYNSRRA